MMMRVIQTFSEDDHLEDEDGSTSHSKRRQDRSFDLTTGAVKRMESKEDGNLTSTIQVGGHAQFINIIPIPNGGTEGVAQHFLKYHRPERQDQGSKGPSWCSQEPPGLYEREQLE